MFPESEPMAKDAIAPEVADHHTGAWGDWEAPEDPDAHPFAQDAEAAGDDVKNNKQADLGRDLPTPKPWRKTFSSTRGKLSGKLSPYYWHPEIEGSRWANP